MEGARNCEFVLVDIFTTLAKLELEEVQDDHMSFNKFEIFTDKRYIIEVVGSIQKEVVRSLDSLSHKNFPWITMPSWCQLGYMNCINKLNKKKLLSSHICWFKF